MKYLPGLLYIEDNGQQYRMGYRFFKLWREYDPGAKLQLLIRGDTVIGRTVFACLDISNGNPDLRSGKHYVWIFYNYGDAVEHYQEHKGSSNLSVLRQPVQCVLYDHIKVPDDT